MATPGQHMNAVPPARPKGCADIVGFGDAGVYVVRNSVNLKPQLAITDFGYSAGGWRVEKHLRLVADVTGTGTGDVVGFGEAGVIIAFNNDNTFQQPRLVLRDFGYSAGIGEADIIGFGDAGVLVAQNNGNGNFGNVYYAINNFGYNQGWRVEKHVRLLGDVTGDGYPDIIGFGENATYLSINNRDGTFGQPKIVSGTFCYSQTWRVEKHIRYVADLTGDGKVDIIGFGEGGMYVALNKGDDGRGDIIGFGNPGVYVSLNNGNGTFQPPQLVINNFGYDGGWRIDKHPRFVVDLTGDGRADIVAFGDDGVYVAFNSGKGGFGAVQRIVGDLGYNAGGWRTKKHVLYPANLYL
ncbi:hypothetical protein AX16_003892 [Volvariella volvacea WC 439]|nr:hypothetical protein AX16_003892 [Volvariella volvacea WC 439]